jgi:hypothetical protein
MSEAVSTDEDVVRPCRLRRRRKNKAHSDSRCHSERCEPPVHERHAGKYVPA